MEKFVILQNLFMHDRERKKVLHETTCVINREEKNSLNIFRASMKIQYHEKLQKNSDN